MSIFIVPSVPRGATLHAFAAAIGHLNVHRSGSATLRLLFGQAASTRDPFGQRAWFCADVIPSGPFSDVSSILENHTLWPLYAYIYPPSVREEWRKSHSSRKKYPSRSFLHNVVPDKCLKPKMFACIRCVEEDLSKFDVSYWRTYHQIPGILHCIEHLTPLVDECRSCGVAIFQRPLSLPSICCHHCGERLSAPPSNKNLTTAYKKTLEITKFLFEGNWRILSPEIRRPYYEFALKMLIEFPYNLKKIKKIENHIKKRWHVKSLKSLSKLFSISIDIKSIQSALLGTDYDSEPLLHILLLEHFSSTQRNMLNLFSSSEMESAAAKYNPHLTKGPYDLPSDKQRELIVGFDKIGIARGAIYGMIAGIRWAQLCQKYFITNHQMHQLYVILPWFTPYRKIIAMDKSFNTSKKKNSGHIKYRDFPKYRKIAQSFAEKGQSGWQEFRQENASILLFM
ncbi:TniQ family protein [Paraburkholderia caribensis]|uniref:TniQ family protein n=1 Tax=Paraburkholderia caribensis TaxID=75105 RepID=UPI0015907024|nr:TniQ family protein [Paraburkholderia caribensis]